MKKPCPVHHLCRCDGQGVIVTCIDDMCQGAGECMHGDGEEFCPCYTHGCSCDRLEEYPEEAA